jgi:hypothetical protein
MIHWHGIRWVKIALLALLLMLWMVLSYAAFAGTSADNVQGVYLPLIARDGPTATITLTLTHTPTVTLTSTNTPRITNTPQAG